MYYRKLEEKRRLEHLYKNSSSSYPQPCYYDEDKQRLIRLYKCDDASWRYHKKLSHRRYRLFVKRNDYYTKKAYDLWWSVW